MRLFALEYFRQFGNADVLHFSGKGKKAQLKVRNQLGHFIYNKMEEGWQEADRMLEGLGLQTSFLWKPYDPNHFISLRRVRYRLASYDHVRLPHIEKYANQPEWKEGTLEEAITQEERAQRAIRNIQKLADLELCSQVFSLPGTHVRAAASSSTAPRKAVPAPITAETSAKDKGKEKQMEPEQPPHAEVLQKEQQEQISEAHIWAICMGATHTRIS